MNLESFPVIDMLDVLVQAVRDKVTEDSLAAVRQAAQDIAHADADARREKSCGIILEIAKMQAARRKMQFQFDRWTDLPEHARRSIDQFVSCIDRRIDAMRAEKKRIDRGNRC